MRVNDYKKYTQVTNIKSKVMTGFGLAIMVVVFAGAIAFSSFTELLNSVEYLTRPDQTVGQFNDLLTNISEAESNIRAYSISDDKKYLDKFSGFGEKIKKNIDTLQSMTSSSQKPKIDSVALLWNEKVKGYNSLIQLKKRKQQEGFITDKLGVIAGKTPDSTVLTTTTTVKTTTETTTIPQVTNPKSEDTKKNGFIGSIKKIFKKEQEKQDNELFDVLKETTVTVDTNVVVLQQPDTVLGNVKKMLSNMHSREAEYQKLLSEYEMDLLRRDNLIMGQIRNIVEELNQEQTLINNRNAEKARNIVSHSTSIIAFIGVIGLISIVVFISLIFKDVTKSIFYRNQLIAAKKDAEQLAKVKEEFLANMSHEIRTPLNAIVGFTEQLSTTPLQTRQKYFLQAIESSSGHLLSTVNDILDFSKIEAGKLTIEKIPFRLNQVVQEVHHALANKASEKGLILSYNIDEQIPDVLLGDPFRLKQVLLNLVSNALKFTFEGSVEIFATQIKSSENSSCIRISVNDTGVGIEKDQMEKIFEGFNQADTSITRKFGGTGLGLTISKRIVELQNGKIWVESTPGKGSSFFVTIEYENTTEDAIIEKKITDQINFEVLKGKKFLVIEDDDFSIYLMHTILQKWNVKADIASDGKEGLDKILKNKYDLVLTDIHIPELSGTELIKIVRSNPDKQGLPIVALTANVMKEELAKLQEAGVSDYMLKPFREAELFRKVIQVLGIKPEISQTNDVSNNDSPSAADVSELEQFAGKDKEALFKIIETLIKNLKNDLRKMNSAVEDGDYKSVRLLAHKMIPSFVYLKGTSTEVTLRRLETDQNMDRAEIRAEVEKINYDTLKLLSQLEEKLLEKHKS